jgi:sensor c-di-GMP phosphodiesterase-like protein
MNSKTTQIVIAVVAIIGLSAATGAVVHHNDSVSAHNAMMQDAAMRKSDAAKKAAAEATAMKKEEAAKQAAATPAPEDAMKHGSAGVQ